MLKVMVYNFATEQYEEAHETARDWLDLIESMAGE